MSKTNTIFLLKEQVEKQKKLYDIKEKFSYRFDSRTRRLILTYTIPKMVKGKSGNQVIRKVNKEKYISQINDKNWKKYFKGSNSIVIDHSKLVEKLTLQAQEKYDGGIDEYDFKWWIDRWLDRKVGKTKDIKPLSHHTIKGNRNHINQYHQWVIEKYTDSVEIRSHIDNGVDWFEEYYSEKLISKVWNKTTCGTSYRNIKSFYNYVADKSRGQFPYDILRRLKLPKAKNKRDKINRTEYEKIIKFIVDNKDDDLWGKFIMFLRLQLKTGMRVSELVGIKNNEVDEEEKCIWVEGKSGRRQLNFNSKDDEIIWEDILKKKNPKSPYLFYQTRVQFYPKQKKRIEIDRDLQSHTTTSFYLDKFREMRTFLGLRGKFVITSQSLRRYFITRFAKETGNRDLTRQIVGHSTTRMTDYYMGEMIEDDTITTISTGV